MHIITTPVAMSAWSDAHRVAGRRVAGPEHLVAALDWALAQPLALLEVRTDRRADADQESR